ncbi:hypothetical protein bpuCAU1_001200 (plasmid) [Borrelia puertoricensis]|uniref:BTA121 domain-containing protein surface lipoprotein n=1 Tax=Borrelia puertoricensis TaxID=2756107 RepID=UPI003EB9A12F
MNVYKIKLLSLLLLLLISCGLFQKDGRFGYFEYIGEKDFDLTAEEERAIDYFKDTLMNFEHFLPGVYKKYYKTYTSDEFYSLLSRFDKQGTKAVARSIIAVLNAQDAVKDAVSKIGDVLEREIFKELELKQNWYKKVLKVTCDDPSFSYAELIERSLSVADVFEKIKISAEVASKIYDTFGLDLYEKRVVRYLLALSFVPGEYYDESGISVNPYTEYELYELLVSPPFGAANLKNIVAKMKGTIKDLHAADASIAKVENDFEKNKLQEQFNSQKNLYDQELKPVLKDPDKLFNKLTSDVFDRLNDSVAKEFARIKQEAKSKKQKAES